MSCNTSVNIFLIGFISSMKTDIRTSTIDQQVIMTFTYVFPIILLVIFALISNLLSIDTCHRIQIRTTTVGLYLLIYSYCSALLLFLLAIRLIQLLDSLSYEGFFSICNVITPFSSILTRFCLWTNGLIGFQRALQSFEFGPRWNRIRSRTAGTKQIITVLICIILMHVPELMTRRALPDPVAAGKFVCQIKYSSSLLVLNTVFSFIHLFVPVTLNIIASCLILASISHRRANLHQRTYWSQWMIQFRNHAHLFISPILTIMCILPQLLLSLLFSCVDITSKWLLRLNIAVALIIHLPQAATFLLFILPSNVYMQVFKNQSSIGKYICYRRIRMNVIMPLSTKQPRIVNRTQNENNTITQIA